MPMNDLTKRDSESITEFTIRRIRFDILSDMQRRIQELSGADLSAIAEQHKIGYLAAYGQATNEIHGMIEDAKYE
jgi:hypothetical protein